MPELPEVETTKRAISKYLPNLILTKVKCYNPNLRQKINFDDHAGFLNQKIRGIFRRAKYILVEFDQQCLLIHLGMSGSLRIITDTHLFGTRKKHDHVELYFQNEKGEVLLLRYHDPRRFGIFLFLKEPINQLLMHHPLLQDLGIEPFGSELTAKFIFQNTREKKQSIKQWLLDSHNIVGIGNIYACEVLFRAKVHPARLANSLRKVECNRFPGLICKTLQEAIDSGGSTLRDFVDSDGKPGYFQLKLNVYGREGQPCHQCKTPISKIVLGQRSTFFCPNCQKAD